MHGHGAGAVSDNRPKVYPQYDLALWPLTIVVGNGGTNAGSDSSQRFARRAQSDCGKTRRFDPI